jgi:3-phytase
MRARILICATAAFAVAFGAGGAGAKGPLVVRAVSTTAALYSYDGAPATPDADDPAIWVDRSDPGRSLVIGTAKDAGLLVYDLAGTLRQAIRPVHARRVTPQDPATPAGINPDPGRFQLPLLRD